MTNQMSAAQLARQGNRSEAGRYAEMLLAEPPRLDLEPAVAPDGDVLPAGRYANYLPPVPAGFQQTPDQLTMQRPPRASSWNSDVMEETQQSWSVVRKLDVQPGDLIRIDGVQLGPEGHGPEREFEGLVAEVDALNPERPVYTMADGTKVQVVANYVDPWRRKQQPEEVLELLTAKQYRADLKAALRQAKDQLYWAKQTRHPADWLVNTAKADVRLQRVKAELAAYRRDRNGYVEQANQLKAKQFAARLNCPHWAGYEPDLHGQPVCNRCGQPMPKVHQAVQVNAPPFTRSTRDKF